MYKTRECKDFQEFVGYSYKGKYYEGEVQVTIEFWRNPLIDIDNGVKLTADALEGVAFKNDRQIRKLTVLSHKCKKGEDRLEITVQELS